VALDGGLDPARLFGCAVVDGAGDTLGRVTALVHRGDGCDVLIERRHWLRHRVLRIDIDDLVETGSGHFALLRRERRTHDGRVA
jgi:hypothetical protein